MLKTVKIKLKTQNFPTFLHSHLPTFPHSHLPFLNGFDEIPLDFATPSYFQPPPFLDDSQITSSSIHPRTKVLLAVKYTYSQFYNCSCPIFHFFVRFLYEIFFPPHTRAKKHTLQGFKKGQIILIMSLGVLPIKILPQKHGLNPIVVQDQNFQWHHQ